MIYRIPLILADFINQRVPSGPFLQLSLLPRKSFKRFPSTRDVSSVGLVIQGPLSNFTLQTVSLYREWYGQDLSIVVSSTVIDPKFNRKLDQLGCVVVTANKPTNPGFLNVNYQLSTSALGISIIKDLGKELVIKHRSDQRLCMPDAISSMVCFYKQFGSIHTTDGSQERNYIPSGRIFVIEQNTYLEHAFHLSDFLILGAVNDVGRYFQTSQPDHGSVFSEDSSHECPEVFLAKRYACDVLGADKSTLDMASYHQLLRMFIGVLPMSSIDLYWNKYKPVNYTWQRYHGPDRHECLTLLRWISLLSDISSTQ